MRRSQRLGVSERRVGTNIPLLISSMFFGFDFHIPSIRLITSATCSSASVLVRHWELSNVQKISLEKAMKKNKFKQRQQKKEEKKINSFRGINCLKLHAGSNPIHRSLWCSFARYIRTHPTALYYISFMGIMFICVSFFFFIEKSSRTVSCLYNLC